VAILLLPFFVLAVIGLILSLVAHTFALFGLPQPLGPVAWALHIGIFVVWIPAVLAARRLDPKLKDRGSWKVVLRGCPVWMRRVTAVFFVYALVNFLWVWINLFLGGAGGGANAPPEVFRGFSGHWMLFYSTAAAILYSAMVINKAATRSVVLAERWLGRPGGEQAEDYEDPIDLEPSAVSNDGRPRPEQAGRG
jgi:hypothetical protein